MKTPTVRHPYLALNLLAAAILACLPHFLTALANHGDYTPFSVSEPISSLVFDETKAYLPGAQWFMTESPRVHTEFDTYERRDRFSAGFSVVPTVLVGFLAKLLGSTERAFVA